MNVRRFWRPPCDGNPHNWRRENVWLLTSVSNQQTADELIPELLRCRDYVSVLGLSIEPLLGPVDLKPRRGAERGCCLLDHRHDGTQGPCQTRGLDRIIVGGESGHHARPMHPDWARSIREQCEAAGVPFFFKQWGEWYPIDEQQMGDDAVATLIDCGDFDPMCFGPAYRQQEFVHVGKKAAGRLLDGRTWSEFPSLGEPVSSPT
jgi:protein gp37